MKFTNKYAAKMAFAFCTFIHGFKFKEHSEKYIISSRMYETFKKQYSILLKEKWAREGANFKGKKHSEEAKRIIGEKSKLKVFKRGPENPNWGKKVNLTPEQKQKRSENSKAIWNSPGYRERHSESRKQFLESPLGQQRRNENGDRLRGVKRDPSIVEKSASKRRGKKGTELFSEQALANIREGNKNRVLSDAGREKIRETTRATGKRPKSEEHKRKISESNKGKHRHVGKANPMYGKTHSEETKRKIAETKLLRKLEKEENAFCGPIRSKSVFKFRGVMYKNLTDASKDTGVSVNRIKTQIKYWGDNPTAEIIQQIDLGILKPPMTAWNKGTKGLQVSWSKGKKLSPEHVAKSVATKKEKRITKNLLKG
jgi:hypothetical protein